MPRTDGSVPLSSIVPRHDEAPISPRRPRILIVDDDRAARETLSGLLEDAFEILTASSGRSALELLPRYGFDVVCTDYDMPGMNGMELLQHLFSSYPFASGILVTGHREYLSTPPSYGRGRVYDILLKPFDAETLERTIARALDRSRVAREIQRRNVPSSR
jgi:two-component system response regulator HupR/HoxA